MDPYDVDLPRIPELESVTMTSSVQLPASDTFGATAGGEPALQAGPALSSRETVNEYQGWTAEQLHGTQWYGSRHCLGNQWCLQQLS